jgi:hypothetical protein
MLPVFQEANMENYTTITLAVGETHHLKTGRDRILYGGMPSENVYSIIQRKAEGYQGFGWNLFFNKRQCEITIDGVKLYIEHVDPESISFRKG